MYTVRAYIIGEDKILEACEGTGTNLTDEDIEAGYEDYVYYTIFDITDLDNVYEDDGGMMLLTRPFKEVYKWKDGAFNLIDDEKVLKDIIAFAFGEGTKYIQIQ